MMTDTPGPVTTETGDLREFFEERSAILECDAGLPRAGAELEAAKVAVTLARNRRYLWASLRAVLPDYPLLLCQVPDRPGPPRGCWRRARRAAPYGGRARCSCDALPRFD